MSKFTTRDIEQDYLNLVQEILDDGLSKDDRTGTGTYEIFGPQLVHDFNSPDELPVITSKKVWLKGVILELLWFISGNTNSKWLEDQGVQIWKEWSKPGAEDPQEKGKIYSYAWRNWDGKVDQLQNAIDTLKDPRKRHSRRIIVSAWNPSYLDELALAPCHVFFQFNVRDDLLDLMMYQRSGDMFLGVPFNITSYCLLLQIVCHLTGLKPGRYIHNLGSAHIYKNHLDQCHLMLDQQTHPFPTVSIDSDVRNLDDLHMDFIKVHNYSHGPLIPGEVSV